MHCVKPTVAENYHYRHLFLLIFSLAGENPVHMIGGMIIHYSEFQTSDVIDVPYL